MSYCLPIEERIVGFIPFTRVLALSEMQTALVRILTCVAESTYDNNHYSMSAFLKISKLSFHFELFNVDTSSITPDFKDGRKKHLFYITNIHFSI